jgi:DUF917 family protein
MNKLNAQNLYDIANGSTLLASGGGGSIKTAYSFIRQINQQKSAVDLRLPAELEAESWGGVVAAMGSPKSFEEIGLRGSETLALKALEKSTSQRMSFTIPVETGSNIFVAMLSALKQEPPIFVVDGDGAGRSVPTLSCLTFSENVAACPFALLNAAKGEDPVQGAIVINLEEETNFVKQAAIVEATTRPILQTKGSFDGIASISGWAMTAETAQTALIKGTISISQYLGECLREYSDIDNDELNHEFVANLAEKAIAPYFLFPNRKKCTFVGIKSINKGDGFDHSLLHFTQDENGKNNEIVIINQNENLLAWNTQIDHPIAMAPDLICCVGNIGTDLKEKILTDFEGQEREIAEQSLSGLHGLSVEDLTPGQVVYLFSLPANDRLKQDTNNIFQQLRAQFGYFGPYVSINQ